MVEFDGVDAGSGAIDKSVKKLSKSQRIVKKSEKISKAWKIAKIIGLKERLPKYWSFVN